MERLVSLISGGGTTMQEIARAIESGEIPGMQMAGVIASKAEAGGIEKAQKLGIPVTVVDPRDFRIEGLRKTNREAFGKRILEVLDDAGATIVTQNGWLPRTPENVTERFSGVQTLRTASLIGAEVETHCPSIFNQHPGPPNYFGKQGMFGKAVHCAVLEFQRLVGRRFDTYVVGQYADAEVDGGSIVRKGTVEVKSGDTVDDLQQRALPIEHRVQIEMLQAFTRGTLRRLPHELLVHHDELELLEQAKAIARERYPNG